MADPSFGYDYPDHYETIFNPMEILNFKKNFKMIDESADGFIDRYELKACIRGIGEDITEEELTEAMFSFFLFSLNLKYVQRRD